VYLCGKSIFLIYYDGETKDLHNLVLYTAIGHRFSTGSWHKKDHIDHGLGKYKAQYLFNLREMMAEESFQKLIHNK
jgi:hypothetical protein